MCKDHNPPIFKDRTEGVDVATLVPVCEGRGRGPRLLLLLLMEDWGCLQATPIPTKKGVGNAHLRPQVTVHRDVSSHTEPSTGSDGYQEVTC